MNYYYDDEDVDIDDDDIPEEEEAQQNEGSGNDLSDKARERFEELKKRQEDGGGEQGDVDNKGQQNDPNQQKSETPEGNQNDPSKSTDSNDPTKAKNEGDSLDPNKKPDGNSTKPENSPSQSSGSSPGSGSNPNPSPSPSSTPAPTPGAEQAGNVVANTASTTGGTTAATSGAAAAGGATAGGATAAAGGAAAAAAWPIALILLIIIVIIVIIIILVGLIMFILTAPGMVTEKLKAFFSDWGQQLANFFLGDDTIDNIEDSEINDILDYLETMGYDLKGYGFISSDVDDGSSNYDYQQGVVRDPDTGNIAEAKSDIIFQYIVSDNYAYTVKNFNQTTSSSGVFAFFERSYKNIATYLDFLNVVDSTKWGNGLITLKFEDGREYKHNILDEIFGWETTWNYIDIDVSAKTMKIRRGWGENSYTFNLDGWTGRYSMPLEFLLSVHIATMKPDLASEMVNSFPTNVDIKLREVSGDIESSYKVSEDKWRTYSQVEDLIHTSRSDNLFSSIINWFDDLYTGKDEVSALFALGIDHVCSEEDDDKCVFEGTTKEKTIQETYYEDGEEKTRDVTIEIPVVKNLNDECIKHVELILKELAKANDYNFSSYTPYIKNVTDHWFRDVYFQLSKAEVEDLNLTRIDLDYEILTNERWTEYETWEDGPESGNYKLYIYDENKKYGIGDLYDTDADGDGVKGTQEDVDYENEKGKQEDEDYEEIKVIKRQIETTAENLEDEDIITLESDGSWSAYENKDIKKSTYKRVNPDAADGTVESKIYYREELNSSVVQKDDGVRGVTNKTIKDMFLNRYYFNYDGTTETANVIKELRDKLGMSYGHIDSSKLDNEYDVTIKTPKYDNSGKLEEIETETKTVKVKDYANKVSLTQDSLAAFSILENTHTLDADFIYKDFKELIVELGYFEKEELSDNIPQVLQFPVPDIGSGGYPNRVLDKKENEFGTQLHSKKDYEANVKNTLAALIAAAPELTEAPEDAENLEHITNVNNSLRSNAPFGREMSNQIANLAQTSLSSSVNLSAIADISPSTYTFEPTGSLDKGTKTGEVEINGITYETWKQTASTCTLYSFAFIATAYTGKPYTDYIMVDGVLINKDREGQGPHNEYWQSGCGPIYFANDDINGTTYTASDSNYTNVAEHVSKGLSEGKPVYFYGSLRASAGYHAVVLLGASSNGKIIYFNPGPGCIEEFGDSSSFPANLKSLLDNYWGGMPGHCIFVPDEAPEGVKKSDPFEGYEGGEAVVAPATGILLEYGTYDKDLEEDEGYRKNSDKQEEVDEVGYAKILVLNEEISDQLVSCTNSTHKKTAREQGETIPEGIVSVTLPNEDPEEKLEELSDIQKALYGYSLFAEDYENGSVGGYLIYIDGFKCELPGAVASDEEADAELGSGVMLSKEKFLNEAATGTSESSFTDCSYQETRYEADQVYKLLSETKEKQQKAKAEAKNLAAPLYKFTGSINGIEQEMLVIKEGTVIGRTFSNEELVEDVRNQTYTSEAEEEVQGNYLRIIMRDMDDSVVENVEDYMKLDDGYRKAGNQEYEFREGDLEILADAMHHEGCGNYCAYLLGTSSEEDKLYLSKSTGFTIINKLNTDSGFSPDYNDPSKLWDSSKSPLYNLLCRIPTGWDTGGYTTGTSNGWYAIALGLRKRIDADELEYCDICFEAAEYIRENDSMNFTNNGKFRTQYAAGDGMPHTMWEQGGGYYGEHKIWLWIDNDDDGIKDTDETDFYLFDTKE